MWTLMSFVLFHIFVHFMGEENMESLSGET